MSGGRAPGTSETAFTPAAILRSGAWLSILFWGASFVATRDALRAFHPYALVAARFALGALVLLLLLVLRREPLLPRRADRARGLLLGLILGVHIAVQAFALHYTSAVHSGWIVGFCPVVIALGAQLFLGQRLPGLAWGGIGLASAGVLLIAFEHSVELARAGWGDLLVFGTTFSWAAYTLLSARAVQGSGPLRTSAFAMAVASLLSALLALVQGEALLAAPDLRAWGSLAFLGLCCSGAAFWLWNRAVLRLGPARLGGLIYFQPFVTAALSVWLLGERVRWNTWLGGPLVVLGVWLMGLRKPRPPGSTSRA